MDLVPHCHATVRHKSAVTRLVDPYKLWYANGGLYLVGLDHDKEDVRVFAVDRIRSVALTNWRFEMLKGFDFEEYQKPAFQIVGGEPQLVRIRFSPEQAPYVAERIWHESQKLEAQPDGSVILSLKVASLWEVKRWLIGWSADAQESNRHICATDIEDDCKQLLRRSQEMGTTL